jgi:hypothetical protein
MKQTKLTETQYMFKRVDRYPINGDGFWIGLKR